MSAKFIFITGGVVSGLGKGIAGQGEMIEAHRHIAAVDQALVPAAGHGEARRLVGQGTRVDALLEPLLRFIGLRRF